MKERAIAKHTQILLFIIIISQITYIKADVAEIRTDVWDEGDWVTYEYIAGILGARYSFIVTRVTNDFIEFTTDINASSILKINTTSGKIIEPPPDQNQSSITDLGSYGIYPNITEIIDQSKIQFANNTLLHHFLYTSQALMRLEGQPVVIPVSGLIIEGANFAKIDFYNYTSGLNETTWQWQNFTLTIEVHTPTGILINTVVSIFGGLVFMNMVMPPYQGFGTLLQAVDSSGIFEVSNKIDTSSSASTTGFLINVIIFPLIMLIFINRKLKKKNI